MSYIRRYGLFGLAAAAMFLIVVVPLAIVIVQGFVVYERGAWHFTLSHLASRCSVAGPIGSRC